MMPKTKSPFNAKARRGGVGMLVVLDRDGDPHYIPHHNVRDITDWVSKWGEGISSVVLSDAGSQHTQFKVALPIEELVECYQRAAAGEMVDLRPLCGEKAYRELAPEAPEQEVTKPAPPVLPPDTGGRVLIY